MEKRAGYDRIAQQSKEKEQYDAKEDGLFFQIHPY